MANVKINTTNTTGGYPEPVNPNTTGALAGGFYPQNSSSNDGNAGIERDSSNNLTVKSAASVNINGSTTGADAVVVAASTTGAALRVTQTGSGNAIVVEDSASPDSTAFVVDAAGNVGIRTTLPSYDLDVQGDNSAAIAVTAAGASPTDASLNIGINDTTGDNYVRFGDGANYEQGRIRYNHDSDYMSFSTAQTEALRIDNTQQVAIGGGAPISAFSVSKDGFATATFRGNGATAGGYTRFIRARGTVASPTIVNNGDYIGGVLFGGYDGSAYRDNAAMYGIVGGAPGASDMPGALAFATAADGTVTLTERMRIDAAGNVGIGLAAASGIRLHVASDTNTWIRAQSAAGIPLLNCNRSNGTTAAPTAVASADELGRMDIRGYANGDFRQAAQISVSCTSTPGGSDTAIASSMSFLTSPGGTTAPTARLYINQLGNVQVNAPASGNALIVKGNVEFNDGTVQATSSGAISRLVSAVTTTSTTFTDITGLTASLAAGTPYFFEAYLIWQQNNTSGGIGFAINGPASMGVLDYIIQYQNFANDAAGTIQTVHATGYDTAYTIPTSTTAANTSYIARINGVLVTTVSGGTLALRFKSNNASYTASIRPGSWLLLRRGNT